jgi:hypothetical protein
MEPNTSKVKFNLSTLLGVGFLVISLAAISITLADPEKRQLIAIFAGTETIPLEYRLAQPSIPTPSPAPPVLPNLPPPEPGFVNPCYSGCSAEDIKLTGQTPGRPGYVYSNGNIAGFYEYPAGSGKYYPVNVSANGPTVNDLNKLAATINAQRAATYDRQAFENLNNLNPSAAKAVNEELKKQCAATKPSGIDCNSVSGLAQFLTYEDNMAQTLLLHLSSAKPGSYTNLQMVMDLSQLSVFLARNIISQDQYNAAVKNANSFKKAAEVVAKAEADAAARADAEAAAKAQIGTITGKAGTGGTGSGTTQSTNFVTNFVEAVATAIKNAAGGSTPSQTDTSKTTGINPNTVTGSAGTKTTEPGFVERVNKAIQEYARSLSTPDTRTETTPTQRVGISTNTEDNTTTKTSTTYVNTDQGLITTTTEITRDTDTGRVTDSSSNQTKVVKSTYDETTVGIVRTDTIATTDLNTGEVVDTKTTTTPVTGVTGAVGSAGAVKTQVSPLANAINNVQTGITNIFSGVGNTFLNIVNGPSTSVEKVTVGSVTETSNTQASSGNFFQNLFSNLFNPNETGTVGSRTGTVAEISKLGQIIEPVAQEPIPPVSTFTAERPAPETNQVVIPDAQYTSNSAGQEFLYFNQFDPKYKNGELYGIDGTNLTWYNRGCGLMVGGMVTNQTPEDFYEGFTEEGYDFFVIKPDKRDKDKETGAGLAMWQIKGYLESQGYTVISIKKDEVNNYTSQGNPVVADTTMRVQGDWVGHLAVVTEVNEEGNYILNDPAGAPGREINDKDINRYGTSLTLWVIIPPEP